MFRTVGTKILFCNHFQISTVDTEYNILHFFTAEEDGSSSQLSAIILENVL
jgi:hypothetical protein